MSLDPLKHLTEIDWDYLIESKILSFSDKTKIMNYQKEDRSNLLNQIRKRGEKIAKNLCKYYKIDSEGRNFYDLVSDLSKTRKIPGDIISYLHSIRSLGNIDSHDRDKINKDINSEETFAFSFNAFLSLLDWFCDSHIKGKKTQTKKRNLFDDMRENQVNRIKFNPDQFVKPGFKRIAPNPSGDKTIGFDQLINDINEMDAEDIVMIIGDPGMGKTSVLKALTFFLSKSSSAQKSNIEPSSYQEILPLYFEMKSINAPLENTVKDFIDNRFKDFSLIFNNLSISILEELMHKKQIIFIFDGLDEFITTNNLPYTEIDKILKILQQIVRDLGIKVILSSRIAIWTDKKFITYKVKPENIFELKPWEEREIKQKIQIKTIHNTKNEESSILYSRVIDNKTLIRVFRNPLFLDLIMNELQEIENLATQKNFSIYSFFELIISKQISKAMRLITTNIQLNEELLWRILYLFALKFFQKKDIIIELIDYEEIPFLDEKERFMVAKIKNSEPVQLILKNLSLIQDDQNHKLTFYHELIPEFLMARLIFDEVNKRNEGTPNGLLTYFHADNLNSQILDFIDESIEQKNLKHKDFFKIHDIEKVFCETKNQYSLSWLFSWIHDRFSTEFNQKLRYDINANELFLDYKKNPELTPKLDDLVRILENKNWKFLILKGFPFDRIPNGFERWRILEWLSIQGWSNLKELNVDLSYLKSLSWLVLKHNQLSELPRSLYSLKNLTHLNISNNSITSIPEDLGNLSQLRELKIHWNPIKEIPPTIKNLINLEDLTIDSSQLRLFQVELLDLPKLRKITVRYRPGDNRISLSISELDLLCRSDLIISKTEKIEEITIKDVTKPSQCLDCLKKIEIKTT